MKHHVVIKLHRPLQLSERIPYWVDFITDKSVVHEGANAEIDRLMRKLALKFWLTSEYRLSVPGPSAEEIREGLNRTYRMVLQEDYDVPADLAARIRLLPSVEDARD